MGEMHRVSILMAVYKTRESVLKEAIASVLAQTYADFELLILDDCPQNTREKTVCAYTDPRIRYFRNEKNLGIAETRNKLMELAQGEYFAVIDHDDVWLPTKLEKQVAFMDAHPDVVACGTAYRRKGTWFRRRLVRHEERHADIFARLFFRCTMYHASVVLRADVVREHQIRYNPTYVSVNDRDLYLSLAQHGKLHNLKEPLCSYRLHHAMTSVRQREAIVAEQRELRKNLLARIGLNLNAAEFEIFNTYLMRSKRIPSETILAEVKRLLNRCMAANAVSGYFPRKAFNHMCAMYRMKRNRKISFGLWLKRLLGQCRLDPWRLRRIGPAKGGHWEVVE